MKKVILILLLIAIPLVYAEITENKKVLNLKVENNTIFLSGDNLNYERELTSNFSRDITWQFFTNATCNVEKALADVQVKIDTINTRIDGNTQKLVDLNTTSKYYDLYAKCYADLSASDSYELKYTTCQTEVDIVTKGLATCEIERDNFRNVYQGITGEGGLKSEYEKLNLIYIAEKSRSNFFLFLAIASSGSLIWVWWNYIRPNRQKGKENNVGRGMDGLK